MDDICAAIQTAHQDKRIYNENGRIYRFFERQCEVQVSKRLVSMLLHGEVPDITHLEDEIELSERKLNQKLAPSQRHAVELCWISTTGRCLIMRSSWRRRQAKPAAV